MERAGFPPARHVEKGVHKMNKKLKTVLIAALLVAAGAGVGAYAASTYGTESDPLVAKSYLDDTLTPKLQAEFQTKLDNQAQQLEQQIASANTTVNFSAVTLSNGQTLKCGAGCELVLRSGAANTSGSLSDVTTGSPLNAGAALTENHLCLTGSSANVTASGSVTLLVRGAYTVG